MAALTPSPYVSSAATLNAAAPGGAGQYALPFNSGGADAYMGLQGLASSNPQTALGNLGTNYAAAYNSSLAMNEANYNNIVGLYGQTQAQQTSAQQAIGAGYTGLYNNVIQGLQGSQQAALNANQQAFTRASGNAAQQQINTGLGNTTVQASTQAGLTGQLALANTATQNQYANTIAGYQSNLGLAGLNYQNQANMQNTAEANTLANFLNSVQAQYPNGQMYNSLAQQAGSAYQSGQDRNLLLSQLRQGQAGRSGTAPLPGLGTGSQPLTYPTASGPSAVGAAGGGTGPGTMAYQSNPQNFPASANPYDTTEDPDYSNALASAYGQMTTYTAQGGN